MSKIVVAANAIINNPEDITNVRKSGNEYYFLYKGKYKWSISESDGEYYVHYYPDESTIDELVSTSDWQSINFVTYSTKDLKTREAYETFSELYLLIKEKLYGVDKVLDDIIGG